MPYIVLQICHSKKVFGTKNNVKFRTFFSAESRDTKLIAICDYLRSIVSTLTVWWGRLNYTKMYWLIFYNRSKRVVIHSTVYLVKFYSKHKNDIYIVVLFLILVQLIRLECSERIIYNFISSIIAETYVQYLFKNN